MMRAVDRGAYVAAWRLLREVWWPRVYVFNIMVLPMDCLRRLITCVGLIVDNARTWTLARYLRVLPASLSHIVDLAKADLKRGKRLKWRVL